MVSKSMLKALNRQFGMEMYASNLYLSFTSFFLELDLDGFANFFRLQADEEREHAMKFFDYVHEVDGVIDVPLIPAPKLKLKSIQDVFSKTLAHEKRVTKSIHALTAQSLKEGDFATHSMLQWFIAEQVEEESLIKNILNKLRMIGDNTSALYLMNEELGNRKADSEDK